MKNGQRKVNTQIDLGAAEDIARCQSILVRQERRHVSKCEIIRRAVGDLLEKLEADNVRARVDPVEPSSLLPNRPGTAAGVPALRDPRAPISSFTRKRSD